MKEQMKLFKNLDLIGLGNYRYTKFKVVEGIVNKQLHINQNTFFQGNCPIHQWHLNIIYMDDLYHWSSSNTRILTYFLANVIFF